MKDQTLDPSYRWDLVLTQGFAKDMGSIHLTTAQLGRIWAQLRQQYELETGAKFSHAIQPSAFRRHGLKLFGMDVVVDESMATPTMYARRHFHTGVENFARQVQDLIDPPAPAAKPM